MKGVVCLPNRNNQGQAEDSLLLHFDNKSSDEPLSLCSIKGDDGRTSDTVRSMLVHSMRSAEPPSTKEGIGGRRTGIARITEINNKQSYVRHLPRRQASKSVKQPGNLSLVDG